MVRILGCGGKSREGSARRRNRDGGISRTTRSISPGLTSTSVMTRTMCDPRTMGGESDQPCPHRWATGPLARLNAKLPHCGDGSQDGARHVHMSFLTLNEGLGVRDISLDCDRRSITIAQVGLRGGILWWDNNTCCRDSNPRCRRQELSRKQS
jgi:hypothetical protein